VPISLIAAPLGIAAPISRGFSEDAQPSQTGKRGSAPITGVQAQHRCGIR
jgi:hypothetical protein